MASKYFKLGLKEKSDKLIKANQKRQRAEDKRNHPAKVKTKVKNYKTKYGWEC